MGRVSDEAVQRNRDSSLARYHRNRGHNQKVQQAYRDRRLEERRFVMWDGEGYRYFAVSTGGECDLRHAYMLFGSSDGDCITGRSLATTDCLELILTAEARDPDVFHTTFSFEYDVNMILSDLPWRILGGLKAQNHCRWTDPITKTKYRIEHVPHKWLRVSSRGVSATLFDGFGFFHCGYLPALKKYNVGTPEQWAEIEAGKSSRNQFTYLQIEDVKRYWRTEISLGPSLMDCIRTAALGGGYRVSEWHGPGALASYLLRERGANKWHSRSVPSEVKDAIRYAYAGGRFMSWQCGLYLGDIYTADRNSAYIYACSLLPRMDRGSWKRQNPDNVDITKLPRFGLYHIAFDAGQSGANFARRTGLPEPPYPLFHRAKNGVLRWPRKTIGWYWTPEAEIVLGSKSATLLEAWIFDDDGSEPFQFVNEAYARRLMLQEAENPAEKAYKWALAAMYGAFARRVGWDRKTRRAPASHELAWAGYITSHCRAAVFYPAHKAYIDGKTRGLISIDTDGITATVPIDVGTLDKGVGKNLGEWKLEHWTGILQWQNGIYWLRDEEGNWSEPKSRGVPKGTVPIDAAFEALAKANYRNRPYKHARIALVRTRFVGYRQAIRGQFWKWRHWLSEPVEIMMGGSPAGKSFHFPARCEMCRTGRDDKMHTITITTPEEVNSAPHNLPWLEEQFDLPEGFSPDEFKFIVRDEDIG